MKATCAFCGDPFVAKTRRARFCSDAHRKASSRQTGPVEGGSRSRRPPAGRPKVSGFERATQVELTRLGKVDTMLGQQALVLARRLSADSETGSAIAALSREHSRIMETLGATVEPEDEVSKARRAREAALRAIGAGGG